MSNKTTKAKVTWQPPYFPLYNGIEDELTHEVAKTMAYEADRAILSDPMLLATIKNPIYCQEDRGVSSDHFRAVLCQLRFKQWQKNRIKGSILRVSPDNITIDFINKNYSLFGEEANIALEWIKGEWERVIPKLDEAMWIVEDIKETLEGVDDVGQRSSKLNYLFNGHYLGCRESGVPNTYDWFYRNIRLVYLPAEFIICGEILSGDNEL